MSDDRKLHAAGAKRTGNRGEELAAAYLTRQGCTILARNWRANPGEIDIVARCPLSSGRDSDNGGALLYDPGQDILAFVEVRTRHADRGSAEESVSRRKAAGMASAALQYLSAHDLDPDSTPWRIDLIAIAVSRGEISSINWVQGAVGEDVFD